MLVDRAELLARPLRKLRVDRLERVGAGLADLRAHVLGLGHVELVGRLRISHTKFIKRADTMAEPFARDEERAPNMEPEGVVLERRIAAPNRVAIPPHVERVVRDFDAVNYPVVLLDAHMRLRLFACAAQGRPGIARSVDRHAPDGLVSVMPPVG